MAPLLAGEFTIWIQPDGPNTKPEYLGCHGVGDVEVGYGDITPVYCPDPAKQGAFKVVGSYQGEPSLPTVQVMTTVEKTADWLEKVACPVTLFIHKGSCGRRDIFTQYDRSFILYNASKITDGLQNLAVRSPADNAESGQTFDFTAESLLRIYTPSAGRQTIAAVRELLAVTFCNTPSCAGGCGAAQPACTSGWVAGAADYAAKAVLYVTDDGGLTWTASAADPFAVAEDISAIVCFAVGRDTTRVMVARGTADGAAPAEIAYSDDGGATWTSANVGSSNGQYAPSRQSLFALDQYNIWLGTNDGSIYYSADGGATWTEQENGVLNTAEWNCIQFRDALNGWAAGENNELAESSDGGDTWTAVTGPSGQTTDDIHALAVIDAYRVFIGYNDGTLWYTENGGTTWSQRTLPSGITGVNGLHFINPLVGWLVDEAGHLLRTIDGGYTWESLTIPTAVALNGVVGCGNNDAVAVGAVSGSTAVVLKLSS